MNRFKIVYAINANKCHIKLNSFLSQELKLMNFHITIEGKNSEELVYCLLILR